MPARLSFREPERPSRETCRKKLFQCSSSRPSRLLEIFRQSRCARGVVFHAPVSPDTTADNFDIPSYLHEAVGAEFDFDLKHIGFWHLRVAMAESYRFGRIFLAGDSAHSHPPYGAYGINTGFEDVRNLGWKLEAVLRGYADESILDTYDEERRPVFASTAADFIENYIEQDRAFLAEFDPKRNREEFESAWRRRGSGADDDIHAYAPNYAGSSIVYGPIGATCSAKGDHQFLARSGHHFAPAPLPGRRRCFRPVEQLIYSAGIFW